MSDLYVVDASVVVKWYLPEVYADHARRLLDTDCRLLAPDLVFSEVGNILWKKTRLGELSPEETSTILEMVGAESLEIYPSWPLVLVALEIANNTQRSVYDSLYLALATSHNCPIVTADRKLCNALQGTPLAPYLLWIEGISL